MVCVSQHQTTDAEKLRAIIQTAREKQAAATDHAFRGLWAGIVEDLSEKLKEMEVASDA